MVPFEEQPVSAPIPMYYFHSDEHPFCGSPDCWCFRNDKQLEALLRAVLREELILERVHNDTIAWEVPFERT